LRAASVRVRTSWLMAMQKASIDEARRLGAPVHGAGLSVWKRRRRRRRRRRAEGLEPVLNAATAAFAGLNFKFRAGPGGAARRARADGGPP
jgi:hypothetical protein